MDIGPLRVPYKTRADVLLEDDIKVKDPLDLFHRWFEEARNNANVIEPNAMCLSTVNKDGIPSARFVLCKGYGNDGFAFFTHYTSKKGADIEENPNVALTFYWAAMNKSIRIEGRVGKLPMSRADEYFNGRPYPSQIGALCSDQSKPIESRQKLIDKAVELTEKYGQGEVPKPEFWGGYNVVPKSIEFWQGQSDRIHDRLKFTRSVDWEAPPDGVLSHAAENGWVYQRLQP